MKKICLLTVVLICGFLLFAGMDFAEVDYLFFHSDLQGCNSQLKEMLENADNNVDKSEVLWRLSRVTLSLGDELEEDDKDGRFELFEKGQEYGEQSYNLNENPEALIWVASNIGRWGQTKGALNSLKKATPMKELLTKATDEFNCLDSSELWYCCGALYDQLPGGFISFGDSVVAVSYMRLAVETISEDVYYGGTYKELAEFFYKRDWSQKKRISEIKSMQKKWNKDNESNMHQNSYYEGHLGVEYVPPYTDKQLGDMTDREEAIEVVKFAIKKFDERPFVLKDDEERLVELRQMFEDYTNN
ncbi:MAG: hypothetical protein WC162_08185 [Sphaerochaetaceae bacterium]